MFFQWLQPLTNQALPGLIVTIHIHDGINIKNPTDERKYCQFSDIKNGGNYSSNERFCLKIGRFFAEILQGEYKETLVLESILKFMMFS